jgi:hypothetical protein
MKQEKPMYALSQVLTPELLVPILMSSLKITVSNLPAFFV